MEAMRATLAETPFLRAPFDAVVQRKWVSRGQLVARARRSSRAGRNGGRLHGLCRAGRPASRSARRSRSDWSNVRARRRGRALARRRSLSPQRSGRAAGRNAPVLRASFGYIGVKGTGGPRRAVRGPQWSSAETRAESSRARGRPGGAPLAAAPATRGGPARSRRRLGPGRRVIDAPASLRDGQRVEVTGDVGASPNRLAAGDELRRPHSVCWPPSGLGLVSVLTTPRARRKIIVPWWTCSLPLPGATPGEVERRRSPPGSSSACGASRRGVRLLDQRTRRRAAHGALQGERRAARAEPGEGATEIDAHPKPSRPVPVVRR